MIATSRPAAEADRAGLAGARRQRVARHLVRRLGHAVRLDHRRAEQPLPAPPCTVRRQRRRRRADEAQRVARDDVAAGARRARAIGLVHRRHGGVPGRLAARRSQSKNRRRRRSRACTRRWRRRPARRAARPIRPWMWNSGITLRQRSRVASAPACARCCRRRRRGCAGSAARSSAAPSCRRCAAPSATSSGSGGRRRRLGRLRRPRQREGAGRAAGVGRSYEHRDAEAWRRPRPRRDASAGSDDQRLGAEVAR